ncbi:MAG: NAD(P)-dependent glycerol-3-phosphate dehydrogenase [Candidatus Omnitrophica bacterium]|nr:NAD(P)-dependent glycerol-3-phosphate dehydrogenase [Candidatus Omnitrophota bacterium]MBU4478145.1 NAD(P)-dependent glycerol-3-phosphate dehydrogenase [Candidatus Omnitrophota bacterium]MCG2704058.1 NAD(P)-dependent glycerol-3-phosphate dehydrogenase [Candidatus Omnitrophota bacterium]
MKITVIGDGGWGTALSVLLGKNKFSVSLWGAFPAYVEELRKKRENIKFLPGIEIPPSVNITSDLKEALQDTNLVVMAVPSQYMRQVARKIKKTGIKADYLSVAKGLEESTAKRMSEVIREELGAVRVAVLSGPNIAFEVAGGIPSAAVCVSRSRQLAEKIQDVFVTPTFRVYTSNDLLGVELAGAFKNIIAIACGISDGLGFGTNTKAALLTRGLVEIARLGVAMGAHYKTFSGLSGMGDLVTTCMNRKSRNRSLGEELSKGKKLNAVLGASDMVVEGVKTTKIALKLAAKFKVLMPITHEVYKVLYENKKPEEALCSLMLRDKKPEL